MRILADRRTIDVEDAVVARGGARGCANVLAPDLRLALRNLLAENVVEDEPASSGEVRGVNGRQVSALVKLGFVTRGRTKTETVFWLTPEGVAAARECDA